MTQTETLVRRKPPTTAHRAKVLQVHRWDDRLFSLKVTRAPSFRFENGQFAMIGLESDGRPLMRAYSMASPNYEESLEFLSIKVPDGPLTSRLCLVTPGDEVLVGSKPTGSLLVSDLFPGRNLYLLASGTGLAPFMSIVRDPYTYECFGKVILVHCVRRVSELAYRDYLTHDLPRHPYLGEMIQERLVYCPTVTRDRFERQGRITDLIQSGRLFADLGLPALDPERDRAMICGSPDMLKDLRALLDGYGFAASPGVGNAGTYVYERAFATV